MKRLDMLRKELNTIENLRGLRMDLKEQCIEHYNHEIECIINFNSPNPEIKEEK